MLGLDASLAPVGKELFQSFVFEAADHVKYCNPAGYAVQEDEFQSSRASVLGSSLRICLALVIPSWYSEPAVRRGGWQGWLTSDRGGVGAGVKSELSVYR